MLAAIQALDLTDARPDPVGGIRTGTWEGALVVGPWGDRRTGAPSAFLTASSGSAQPMRGSMGPMRGPAPADRVDTGPDETGCPSQRSSTGTKSRWTTPV
ncbi:hypothetical protein GCM10009549_40780 [Streptomyces thermoalcalitolerans]|uniref:Uncharacterized protein n=1 Tax=Streptomyces thermoalcalitolerans TaxID=65605 RepID=A0ABP3ZGB3_9ACTN